MEVTNPGNSVAGEIPQQDRGGSVVVVESQQDNTRLPSLAAVLNENDRKRRQRLVPQLVRLLFGALDETKQGEEKEDPKNYNQDVEWDVVEEIVGSTSGSIQLQLSTLLSTSKTRWNQNRPLTIHWSWKTPSCDGNSAVAMGPRGQLISQIVPCSGGLQAIARCESIIKSKKVDRLLMRSSMVVRVELAR